MNPQQPYQQAPGGGYGQPPPGWGAPTPPTPRNGMGTAALVLGIVAILFAFIPFVGFVSYPLAILGIIFGLLGLSRVGKKVATNRGVTLTGLILSVIGLVLVIVSTVLYVSAINVGVQSLDKSLNAPHNLTYKAEATGGGKLSVAYSQGNAGSGGQATAASPWSQDVTVNGSFASLTVSSSPDLDHPDQQVGVSCTIVDRDTGRTVVTNSVPPSEFATVSCTATDLGR